MDKYITLSSLLLLFFSTVTIAQSKRTPLDDYLEGAKTIVIGRCIASGPVNKIAQATVELEILHIVKGDPELKILSTTVSGRLKPGEMYLIRIPDHERSTEKPKFGSNGFNVIPIASYVDVEFLKTLSPRIIVLRLTNTRLAELETTIRLSEYERENLKVLGSEN